MASKSSKKNVWDLKIVRRAVLDSFLKLDPRHMMGNPVMFVVEVGSVITTVLLLRDPRRILASICRSRSGCGSRCCSPTSPKPWRRAAARRKPTRLRKARSETIANRIVDGGRTEQVPSSKLRAGDVVVVSAGEFVPSDGEIIEGVASVDESAITGESAPVIREAGGDRSAVTGGTRVLSDQIKVKVTSNPGETFLDRMIALVEGAERQKTPNEIALNILLAGLDHHLPAGRRDPAAVRHLLRLAADGVRAGFAAGLPDSNDHWRSAFRHRYCRHGSADSAQCARHVRAGRRGGWRRGHLAARQDWDHHAGQPAGGRVYSRAGRKRARNGRRRAALVAG